MRFSYSATLNTNGGYPLDRCQVSRLVLLHAAVTDGIVASLTMALFAVDQNTNGMAGVTVTGN